MSHGNKQTPRYPAVRKAQAFLPDSCEGVEPLLVSAKDAARALALSERTIYTLAEQGQLKPKRVGRRVLFLKADIERFAADVE